MYLIYVSVQLYFSVSFVTLSFPDPSCMCLDLSGHNIFLSMWQVPTLSALICLTLIVFLYHQATFPTFSLHHLLSIRASAPFFASLSFSRFFCRFPINRCHLVVSFHHLFLSTPHFLQSVMCSRGTRTCLPSGATAA